MSNLEDDQRSCHEGDREKATPRSLAEWVSFGIALLVLTAVLGLVIYSWVTIQDQPPTLAVKTKLDIRQAEGQFYIPFEVTNTGGVTVESVEVIAQLSLNGQIVETGQTQIGFLSGGEVSSGAFIFNHNPAQGNLLIRVASYKLP